MSAISLLALNRIRRGWLGLVSVAVLGGVVGGLATATIAGERRGASAADRLISVTLAPELTVAVNSADPADVEQVLAAIDGTPGAGAAWALSRYIGRTAVAKDWYYPLAGAERPADLFRPVVDEGRLPDDDAVDELAITRQTSINTGLALGDEFDFDVYSPDQFPSVSEDSEVQPAGGRIRMRIVGVLRDPSDIGAARTQRTMLGSAALHDRYPGLGEVVLVKLDTTTTPAAFERSLVQSLPPDLVDVSGLDEAVLVAKPSLRVIQVGLWLMAAVIAATGVVLVNQLIRRRVAETSVDDGVLRAIGLDRHQRVWAGAAQGAPAAVGAGAVGLLVAVLVSPVFPVGGPRALEPALGMDVDIVVLPAGAMVTLVTIAGLFVLASFDSLSTRAKVPQRRPSRAMTVIGDQAPVAIALGVGLVGDRGADRTGRPMGRGILAIALGIGGLIASATWLTSLDHLTTTSADYGVGYDLSMEVPVDRNVERTAELVADPRIEMVAQLAAAPIVVGSRPAVGTAIFQEKGSLEPLVLAGRRPAGPTEVALGPGLAAELGIALGAHVDLATTDAPVDAEVVGLVLDPRIAPEDYQGGVLLTSELQERAALGPPFVVTVVRYGAGTDTAAMNADLDERYPWGVMDESFPAPPPPILNLVGVRSVPVFLAWFFALVAVVSLVSTVLAAARRHRRTLAVVRSLGLRPTQLRATLRTLAVTMVVLATALGAPAGLLAGSLTWTTTARSVDVLPVVVWPTWMLVGAVAALVFTAVLATVWPAQRLLAQVPAEALRSE